MNDSPEIPTRTRHDGWTGARRRDFIEALFKVGNVRDACRTIGLSNQAAYKLRARDADFAAEWDAALKRSARSLEAVAYARAVEGVEEPVFHGGVQVGTKRKTSDALLRLLLQASDPEKYGRTAKGSPVQLREQMEAELEARVKEIEHAAYNRAFIAFCQEYDYGIETEIMHSKMCINPVCRECHPDRTEEARAYQPSEPTGRQRPIPARIISRSTIRFPGVAIGTICRPKPSNANGRRRRAAPNI